MTDVLKIALDRRAELHEEVEKLDEFIRMAEMLIRTSQQRPAAAEPEESEMPRRPARVAEAKPEIRRQEPESQDGSIQLSRPQVIRRGPAANSA